MRRALPPLALALFVSHASGATCPFAEWTTYRTTQLHKHLSIAAYLFQTPAVKVDADGAPNAYHPDDMKLHCTKGEGFKGLDWAL